MAYNTKKHPFWFGRSQRLRAMPPVILRDGIAHSGGKCVANEPLTPSERRERAFFRSGPRPKWHPLKSQKGAKIMKNQGFWLFLMLYGLQSDSPRCIWSLPTSTIDWNRLRRIRTPYTEKNMIFWISNRPITIAPTMGLPYVASQNPKIIDFELEIHLRVVRWSSYFTMMHYPWLLQVASVSAPADHLPGRNFRFFGSPTDL